MMAGVRRSARARGKSDAIETVRRTVCEAEAAW
jgi:hypothetical protein